MIITIRGDSIDITEIPLNHHIEWESLLNELNAEHIPGWYQDGKRMGVSRFRERPMSLSIERPTFHQRRKSSKYSGVTGLPECPAAFQ
jgi:hypothetical protein